LTFVKCTKKSTALKAMTARSMLLPGIQPRRNFLLVLLTTEKSSGGQLKQLDAVEKDYYIKSAKLIRPCKVECLNKP
jgi:hypothetical protein